VSIIIEATSHVLSSDKHHIIEQFTHGWMLRNICDRNLTLRLFRTGQPEIEPNPPRKLHKHNGKQKQSDYSRQNSFWTLFY